MAIEYVCFATPAMEDDMPLVRVDKFIPATKNRAARVEKTVARDPLAKINVFTWKAGVKLSGEHSSCPVTIELIEKWAGCVVPVARAGAAIHGSFSSYDIAAAAAMELNEKQIGCTQTGKIKNPPVRDAEPDRVITQLDLTEAIGL